MILLLLSSKTCNSRSQKVYSTQRSSKSLLSKRHSARISTIISRSAIRKCSETTSYERRRKNPKRNPEIITRINNHFSQGMSLCIFRISTTFRILKYLKTTSANSSLNQPVKEFRRIIPKAISPKKE